MSALFADVCRGTFPVLSKFTSEGTWPQTPSHTGLPGPVPDWNNMKHISDTHQKLSVDDVCCENSLFLIFLLEMGKYSAFEPTVR